MNYSKNDFVHTFHCSQCRRPVTLRIPAPLQASLVIAAWKKDFGGKCKDCIEKVGNKP